MYNKELVAEYATPNSNFLHFILLILLSQCVWESLDDTSWLTEVLWGVKLEHVLVIMLRSFIWCSLLWQCICTLLQNMLFSGTILSVQIQGWINCKLLKTVHFLQIDRDVSFQSDLLKTEIKKASNSENWLCQMMVQHFSPLIYLFSIFKK